MLENNYGYFSRLLHAVALGISPLAKASFEVDQLVANRARAHEFDERPIFISGLARSGTTILLRAFALTGCFRSLTYRDMPFPLMPCLWNRISRPLRRNGTPTKRAHGDDIAINYDSPEAFEEIFWKTFCRKQYIFPNHLEPHKVDRETVIRFRQYVRRILDSNLDNYGLRYLSKNNNNLLRLHSIVESFPSAILLIPFRNPGQQAMSLFRQHLQFSERHQRESFSKRYMQWLGHYDFGSCHKPPLFISERTAEPPSFNSLNANYWLELWINTYQHLLCSAPKNSVFVCFDDLNDERTTLIEHLLEVCQIESGRNIFKDFFRQPQLHHTEHLDQLLIDKALAIFDDLRRLRHQ